MPGGAPPPVCFLNVTVVPPWMLNTIPLIVPSSASLPETLHGSTFGNVKSI